MGKKKNKQENLSHTPKNRSHCQGLERVGWGTVWCSAVGDSDDERRQILAKELRTKILPALRGGKRMDLAERVKKKKGTKSLKTSSRC